MSNERRKAREARETQAQAHQEATPKPAGKPKAASRPASKKPAPKKQQVYRQRRFPPLPVRLKIALALGWLTVVLLGGYLSASWSGRLGIAVVATFALPLIVVIVRDPTRRTPR